MTRRLPRDDSGASLLLVLVIVTIISLTLSVLLSFADTSIRTTIALRDRAAASATADGAIQSAINTLRNSDYSGSAGQQCLGAGNALALPRFAGADSAVVTCTGEAGSVPIHCPSAASCNRPGNALLTVGSVAGEDGIRVDQPGSSLFRVRGAVFSNSNIRIANGTLTTNGAVTARGACAGAIQSTPPAQCNYGSTANPLGNDPGYTPDTTTVPAWRPLPACTTPNSVVTFEPGYYDNAKGLTDMMAGNSACRHSTWWFKPGVYYFDFHNTGTDANPLLNSSGGNVWTVDDGYLVAGTPTDTAGAVVSAPASPAVLPGACLSPIDSSAAVGVQFIFGGDSRLVVKSGQVEICGTYSTSRPPVAVYGLTSGSASPVALTSLKPVVVTDPGEFGTSTASTFADADGSAYGTWTYKKGDPDSGSVTVSGFAPPSPIPAGSVLESAAVKVTHRHSATTATDTLTATLTPDGGSAITGSATGLAGSSFQTTTVPLDSATTGNLAQAVYAGTFTGARIALSISTGSAKNDTEDVDAIQLELSYTPPAFRTAEGCVVTGPYTGQGSTSCALITTVNNSRNQFYVRGTTYAPLGVVDLTLNNAAQQVFRFGTIARAVWIKETGSFAYQGPVIEVPDDTSGGGMSVYLDAYVCPRSPTCSPTGTPAVRSRVAFVDADPSAPVPGRRGVVVLSWSTPY